MILFTKFTQENLEDINSLEENELEKAVQTYKEAASIISKHLSDSPDLLRKYPEFSEAYRELNLGIRKAQRQNDIKRSERKVWEEEQRQQRFHEEERKRREEESYQQYVKQERRKRGLRYGVPPRDSYSCPAQFPIRATAEIDELDARGIYYYTHERAGVKVYWCFASPEEAMAENFRRPYKTPPEKQPR
ncbi:hypothetical protein OSCI_90021 [Kamptonema sp. PCC 6506]|nr:hypothetical protein OSCI_90021 [Kamptonema sp. PCC 6506]